VEYRQVLWEVSVGRGSYSEQQCNNSETAYVLRNTGIKTVLMNDASKATKCYRHGTETMLQPHRNRPYYYGYSRVTQPSPKPYPTTRCPTGSCGMLRRWSLSWRRCLYRILRTSPISGFRKFEQHAIS
jgi:hypothetical protein